MYSCICSLFPVGGNVLEGEDLGVILSRRTAAKNITEWSDIVSDLY